MALLTFCENTDDDQILESKLIAFALDYVHKADSTVEFFVQNAKLDKGPKKFDPARAVPKILKATGVKAKQSVLIQLCEELREEKGSHIFLEDFCKEINGFRT